jgi:hypothetical protein
MTNNGHAMLNEYHRPFHLIMPMVKLSRPAKTAVMREMPDAGGCEQ